MTKSLLFVTQQCISFSVEKTTQGWTEKGTFFSVDIDPSNKSREINIDFSDMLGEILNRNNEKWVELAVGMGAHKVEIRLKF